MDLSLTKITGISLYELRKQYEMKKLPSLIELNIDFCDGLKLDDLNKLK